MKPISCSKIKVGTYLHVKKYEEVETPQSPSADSNTYKYGEDNGSISLPVGYEILGYLNEPIKVGESININRTHRNGVEMSGHFTSSPIVSIKENKVFTHNSQYEIIVMQEK
jgi:hypothetical protein